MLHLRLSRRSALVPLACALIGACAAPTAPAADAEVELMPAAASFTRPPDGAAAVAFTVANRGEATVRLTSRCGDRITPAVERREGDRWAAYAGGVCLAIYDASPVALAAGAVRAETVAVRDAGEYRLVVGTDRGPITSAAFRVQ